METRNDEIRHFQHFVQIYIHLTGQQPKPQKTVDFHLDIADETSDARLKKLLQRADADEQNHGVWFLNYFTELK